MKIILLGAPGAGKGTQASMIADHFHLPHISTGDIFRSNIKAGTELGKKVKYYIESGLLVPDELTTDLVVDRIHQSDCEGGYILDGFPRTIPQAECLDKELSARGETIDVALNVYVLDQVIIDRMSGRRVCASCGETYHVKSLPPKEEGVCDLCQGQLIQREDDRPETVLKRLTVYRDMTEPLIDYYGAKGILKTVNGDQDHQLVFDEIKALLGAEE